MRTWRELRAACEEQLARAGVERPARLVLDWFDDVFGRASRRDDEAVPTASLAQAQGQLERLLAGEPLAYVTGVAHFYGYELDVAPGVLIPRPETEELVRWVLESHELQPALRFADWCTGSGCIAVALALRRLTWRGVAYDASPHAVAVAQANVRKHDLGSHLRVRQADIFAAREAAEGPYDLIVSNPPYIPASDWHRVDAQVADHEPRMALVTDGDDALLFYRRLAAMAPLELRPGGWLYVECNDRYAHQVAEYFKANSLNGVEVLDDMQGKPRHVRAQRV